MSANLGLTLLSPTQASKTSTINSDLGAIDAALTENQDVNLTAGNVSLNAGQVQLAIKFSLINATVAARQCIFPGTVKRLIFVTVDSVSNTQAPQVKCGTTVVTLAIGGSYWVWLDGTANGMIVTGVGTAGLLPSSATQFKMLRGNNAGAYVEEDTPVDVAIPITGLPTNGQKWGPIVFAHPVRLVASATGSFAKSLVNATASTTFTLKKNGSSIGTIVWSAAGNTGAFTGISQTDFAAGDYLTLEAPGTADATLADICITLLLVRR